MSPALRASIGGTILVPPFKNEQGDSLWVRRTYRHLRRATVSGAARCQTQGHLNALHSPRPQTARMPIATTIFFRVLIEILVLEMDLQHKAIGFSSSPPSDRSCGSEDCSGTERSRPDQKGVCEKRTRKPASQPLLEPPDPLPLKSILGGDMVHLACHGIHKIRTLPETGWGAPGSS